MVGAEGIGAILADVDVRIMVGRALVRVAVVSEVGCRAENVGGGIGVVGAVLSGALWSGTNKNRDVSIGPLARPFVHSEIE